jgi:hypothetical protein
LGCWPGMSRGGLHREQTGDCLFDSAAAIYCGTLLIAGSPTTTGCVLVGAMLLRISTGSPKEPQLNQ